MAFVEPPWAYPPTHPKHRLPPSLPRWVAPRIFADLSAPSSARQMLADVAVARSTTTEAILGPSRLARLVRARQEVMWRLRQAPFGWSYHRIGRFMRSRDHTTALHGVRQHQARLER